MRALDSLEWLFVGWAFFFQLALIAHFVVRRRRFDWVRRYGWVTYTLALPATAVSVLMLLGNRPWWLWIGGFLCLAWALFGYVVEYVKRLEWRSPIRWPIFAPYLILYLATNMFYWWPLGLFGRGLWLAYTLLFVISTVLNATSHNPARVTAAG